MWWKLMVISGKDRTMEALEKKFNKYLFFAALIMFLTAGFFVFAAQAEKDIWSEDSDWTQRYKLSEQRIKQLLNQLAEKEPEKAAKLRDMRKKDSKKFRAEIRDLALKDYTRPGRWRERMQQRHQKRHDAYIKWLENNYPDEAAKLKELQEKEPDEYLKHYISSRRRFGPIMEAQEKNPELAEVLAEELELKDLRGELIKELLTAKDNDKQKELAEQLKNIISRRFDLIIKKKQLRYEALLRRIEQLRKKVQDQKAEVNNLIKSKDQATKARFEELIGKNEKLNWE